MYKIIMKRYFSLIAVVLLCSVAWADKFDQIKKDLSRSGCQRFVFINTIESDVFNSVDTVYGKAYISSDGRYIMEIGDDIFLADYNYYYDYVAENNQVIIEKRDSLAIDEILYITRLDKLYNSHLIKKDISYRLIKKEEITGDFPDSMIVHIDSKNNKLKQIEYFDVNDALNRIIFLEQEYFKECEEIQFEADFPDTVEKVKL